ncbi:MAG TPA: alpha/beta hydrolase domain-containing protein [Acidimicrobiales bacterium]|nr:alpha/beta hydrolase domain-containing protein [Acidimicrobiales bacterium]
MAVSTALAVGAPAAGAGAAGAGVYNEAATFTGPVTTGHLIEPLSAEPSGLAAHDYVEQEFFASGTAHAFKALSDPADGKWTITPTTSAPYTTRVIVRRPANPARFSGTVVVEWMNVSAGESAPDWDYFNPALMDAGDAYIGVSAQALAVNGGAPLLGGIAGTAQGGLVQQEPDRYGTLHHPGDQYALDMFDQIGLGVRSTHSSLLGPLKPRHVVATGESQSAFYLTTFADALQPRSHAFDGIFIHSRGGSGASLAGTSIASSSGPSDLRIRTDLHEPVFMFETQTDLIQLGYAPAQQPNTSDIRTWEIAGTSHADNYLVGPAAGILGCTTPVNSGPQHVVAQAAFTSFIRWVVHGTPPPSPAPFKLQSTHPAALALDTHGNVIGGVRTPAVDVPSSTLSGAPPAGASAICSLFGSTTVFTPQTLASLYGTKAHYLKEYSTDLDKAIKAGYLLPAERSSLMALAEQVQFPAS